LAIALAKTGTVSSTQLSVVGVGRGSVAPDAGRRESAGRFGMAAADGEERLGLFANLMNFGRLGLGSEATGGPCTRD
jgi:hypothetical protein